MEKKLTEEQKKRIHNILIDIENCRANWDNDMAAAGISPTTNDDLYVYIEQLLATAVEEGKRETSEVCKEVILRRTRIPADAKNPTRDWAVILGEQLCELINEELTALQESGVDNLKVEKNEN